MFNIVGKRTFNADIFSLEFYMPAIAQNARSGHYVDIHMNLDTTALTLPVAATDVEKGTFTIVQRAHDLASEQLNMLNEGDEVFQIRGPLGSAGEFPQRNKALLIAQDIGVASLRSRAAEFQKKGTHTICVLGFATKDDVFWQDELSAVCDELYVATEDGSFGLNGKVTGPIKAICETHKDVDQMLIITDLKPMKRAAKIASDYNISASVCFDAVPQPTNGENVFEIEGQSQETFEFGRAAKIDADAVDFDKLIARQKALTPVSQPTQDGDDHVASNS